MKTKYLKTATILSFVLFFVAQGITQDNETTQNKGFHYGARFGLGEGIIQIDGKTDESSKLAMGFGATSVYQVNRFFGLSAEFLFTSKGGKYNGQRQAYDVFGVQKNYAYQDNFKLFYGEVPLMLKLNIPLNEDLSIRTYLGPSIQFQFLALETREYADAGYNENNGYYDRKMNSLSTVETAFVYGAGLEVRAADTRTFFLDLRVNNSLSELGRIYNEKAKSSYYMISIGYLF